MSRIRLQIRPGDCDSFGHVNNAAYAQYLQYALAETLTRAGFPDDWRQNANHFWEPCLLQMEYRQAAMFGDSLEALLWLVTSDPTCPVFGFEIERAEESSAGGNGSSVLRARTGWQRISTESALPVSLPEELLGRFPQDGGALPRRFSLPSDPGHFRNYQWEHRVMRAEAGPSGLAHPQSVYHWLEESVFEACEEGGWPPERREAEGFHILQMRHDTEFFRLPGAGDSIQVTSRLIDGRRFRGTWLQEIRSQPLGERLVCNYSTGIFVDLEGHPTTPTREMLHALQRRPT